MNSIAPKPYLYIFRYRFNAFHVYGILGYFIGSLVGLCITAKIGLNVWVTATMCVLSAVTFVILAFISLYRHKKVQLVYYHQEIAIILVLLLYLSLTNKDILNYLDIGIIGIAIFLGFGRLGCNSMGCCHGLPYRFGVTYGIDYVKFGFPWYYRDITLIPIQIIESVFVILAVILSLVLILNGYNDGYILSFYSLVYGCLRFVFEVFRGDPERPYIHCFSEAQITSIILIAITCTLEIFGILPYYKWHVIFSISLIVILSVILIINFEKDVERQIRRPDHLDEIADIIKKVEIMKSSSRFTALTSLSYRIELFDGAEDAQIKNVRISKNGDRLSAKALEVFRSIINKEFRINMVVVNTSHS